jgi:hypothetical protein
MSNFTGNAELCVDISETILTTLMKDLPQPGLSGTVAQAQFVSLIGGGTAKITFSFSKLVIASKTRANVTFNVNCTPSVGGSTQSEMSGTATLLVPFKLSALKNNTRNVVLDFTDSSVKGTATLNNLDTVAKQLGWNGTTSGIQWTPEFVNQIAEQSIQAVITNSAKEVLPLTSQGAFTFVAPPLFNGAISGTSVTFAPNGVALTTLVATSSHHGVLSVLGSLNLLNVKLVNPSLKNAAAIDNKHDLGIALSQAGYHDQIFCPNLAAQLNIANPEVQLMPEFVPVLGLCASCGLVSGVSIGSGVNLNEINTSLVEGQADLSGVGSTSFTGGSATAAFSGHTTFSFNPSGAIVPNTTIDNVSIDISLDWWAVLLDVVLLGGLPIASIGDIALEPIVKSLLQKKIDNLVQNVVPPSFPTVTFNSVKPHAGALLIMGQSALDKG